MGTVNRFEDLECWQNARLLARQVYAVSRQGDFGRDFGLRDQIQRAAVSVMGNIAEGFHAGSTREFLRFLGYARRSLAEVQSHLYLALDQHYLAEDDFHTLFALTETTFRQINAFIAYLRRYDDRRLSEPLPTYDASSPTAPLNPTTPTILTTPTNVTNPTTPTNVTNPTTPTNVTNPTNPTNATNPTNPTNATTPTNPTTASLQPNSRHCFVCGLENPFGLGMRFFQTGEDEVTATYIVPERYQGYPGVVHGGIVAAMLDEATGRALMGTDPETARFMYTARLEVKYRQNVPVGEPLRLVGKAVKNRRRAAVARAFVYNQEGAVLAEAEALLVDVPEDVLQSADREALGWKVYPL